MAELSGATVAAIDGYWAGFFGCDPAILSVPATTVVPHVGLGDYHGLWLFRRYDTLIVSVPPARLEHDRAAFGSLPAARYADLPTIYACIAAPIERVVGPVFVGYADSTTFQPVASPGARLLSAGDQQAFERFQQACPALDWEHGGSRLGSSPLVGCFVDGALVALAGYELWGERIAHIAVVTQPTARGHGFGKQVVSALAAVALEHSLIPQYRTLLSNTASLAIGAALGFQPYAESLAVRLLPASG
jgi:GNAT superfamily N-acetyltransferase